MVDQATFQGNWNQIKGKIKEKYGQMTDDDLQSFNGNMDQLIGKIQQRTGEGKQQVEEFLGTLSGGTSNILEKGRHIAEDAMQRGQEYMNQGVQRSREMWEQTSGQVGERFSDGYHQAEDTIKSYPTQAVAVAFAAGLVTGLGMCLLAGRRETTYERTSRRAEDMSDYVYDAVQRYLPQSIKQYMHS
jgi:uncharacterized protein YjbJ (UPF0337 family)